MRQSQKLFLKNENNIILMHFGMKSTLKSSCNHTLKHASLSLSTRTSPVFASSLFHYIDCTIHIHYAFRVMRSWCYASPLHILFLRITNTLSASTYFYIGLAPSFLAISQLCKHKPLPMQISCLLSPLVISS